LAALVQVTCETALLMPRYCLHRARDPSPDIAIPETLLLVQICYLACSNKSVTGTKNNL
jgi:hypothetical protein